MAKGLQKLFKYLPISRSKFVKSCEKCDKNFISILVTDYIQKRRGQALLFSSEYNLLPNLISNFSHYMDRTSVVELQGAELIWCILLLTISCRKGPCIMQIFGLKKVKLSHHITSAPSNSTTEDILIPHFKENIF